MKKIIAENRLRKNEISDNLQRVYFVPDARIVFRSFLDSTLNINYTLKHSLQYRMFLAFEPYRSNFSVFIFF